MSKVEDYAQAMAKGPFMFEPDENGNVGFRWAVTGKHDDKKPRPDTAPTTPGYKGKRRKPEPKQDPKQETEK